MGSPQGPGEQSRVDAVETCFIPSSKEVQNSIPSAGKLMATIFWDSKGLLLIDYQDYNEWTVLRQSAVEAA